MSILWIGWELFINLLEEGMFYYLLTKTLGYKKDKVVRLYLGFFLLIIFTTILNVAVQHTNIVIFLLLVADIVFSTVCFESNYSSRFFWGCSASVIGILSNTVVFSMVSFFTNYDLNTLTVPSTIRIQMTLIYLVVCSVFYFTIIELSSKKAILLPRVLQIVLFILLSLGIVASDMLIELSLSIPGNQITSKLGFIGVVYLSVLLGCVFLFEVLGDYFHKNSALRLQLREASLLDNHLENIQASMKTLRQWKHDYHHHTQAMQMLLENQQYSELNTYLAQFNSDFTNLTSMVST